MGRGGARGGKRGRPVTRGKKPPTGRPPGRPSKGDYGFELVGQAGQDIGLWGRRLRPLDPSWVAACNYYYGGGVNWLR